MDDWTVADMVDTEGPGAQRDEIDISGFRLILVRLPKFIV